MPTVVVVVVCGGRAFSGGAVARVVGDVGGGRDGAPRPFGCRAVMIAHACTPGRFGAVGPARQWQMQPPAVNARGARFRERGSLRSINCKRGGCESLTSPLSVCSPCFSLPVPGCAPPCLHQSLLRSRAIAALTSPLARNGSTPTDRSAGSLAMDAVDSDEVRLARAREWQSVGAKRGGGAPGVDRSTGDGPGAQPAVRLRRQLHRASRAWLHRAGEPIHARVVPPLRGGAPQLHPNAIPQAATFVGVCEGFLGIPVNWNLWVHLFRAELHTLATTETRVRRVVRAGGLPIALWESRREWYLPCTMTSNNAEW
jgi:hypothetical protein